MDEKLTALVADGIAKANFADFRRELNRTVQPISYGLLVHRNLVGLIPNSSEPELSKLILQERIWKTVGFELDHELSLLELLLFILWQDLHSRLMNKLTYILRTVNISPHGVVYCYFGKAELNILVEYRILRGGKIMLSPLVVRRNPIGVLELSHVMKGATPKQQNAIKNAVLSVDKVVYQRGSITHVNRQTEDVFGPSIDTILLAELVVEKCNDNFLGSDVSALEIGPGSGHLSVILANTPCIKQLATIDINAAAVHCTLKNFKINEVELDAKEQIVRARAERFSSDQLRNDYDLIVCNPPYLPTVDAAAAASQVGYSRAVGTSEGLKLCTEVLENLHNMLSKKGALLLMTSSATHEEVLNLIPGNFTVSSLLAEPRRVPLDVDTLWEFPDVLDELIKRGRAEKDSDGVFWHYLIPIWIEHKGQQNAS